jgi:hypothetical protein
MLQIILTKSFYNMNTQNIQSTQSDTTTLNTQNNKRVLNTQSSHKTKRAKNGLKANQGKRGNAKQRAPRYKFDETWIEAIKRCIKNGHDYNDRSHAYSADDITNLIRQYLEGTNECTELYDSSFGCAWVVIKAEIDRRKARNARARERRLQHRAAAQTIHGTARASEEAARETTQALQGTNFSEKTAQVADAAPQSQEVIKEVAQETASGATVETQAIATGQMPANVQAQTTSSVQTDATVQTNTSVQTKVQEHTATQAKAKAHTPGRTKAHGKAKAHARAEQLCHRNNGKTVFQKLKLKASQRRNSLNARVGKSLCNRNRHRLQHA